MLHNLSKIPDYIYRDMALVGKEIKPILSLWQAYCTGQADVIWVAIKKLKKQKERPYCFEIH